MNKFFEGLMIIIRNVNTFLQSLLSVSFLTLGCLMVIDVIFPLLKMGITQRVVWYITQVIKISLNFFSR